MNDYSNPFDLSNISNIIINPTVYAIIAIIVLIVFVLYSFLGNSSNQTIMQNTNDKSNINIFMVFVLLIFAFIIVAMLIQYYYNISITTVINNLFSNNTELDIIVEQKLPTTLKPIVRDDREVFNIPDNNYTYGDAKLLCKAYDARLATYEEIENSYNNGGEWCNYGWSDGQMALYPTQKQTYNKLQKEPGHKHDCGRPGVNGGYMRNPNLLYGVNCYGKKPQITTEEQEMLINVTPYPKTESEIKMEEKVAHWKSKINDILVSPFNYTSWNKI
jgi:hypothetical protein